MAFGDAITQFFHDMAIMELRIRNHYPTYAKLGYTGSLYLDIISAHQGEYTPSKLADLLHVARPAVTQKLNQLEKDGYITKKQNPADKREYFLYYQQENLNRLTDSVYTQMQQKIENTLSQHYTKEDLDKFSEILSFIGEICTTEQI